LYLKCKENDVVDCIDKLNLDLSHIFNWLCFSKLALNVSKTKAMIVTYKANFSIPNAVIINNQAIEFVDNIKYLGVFIDSNLSFSKHYEHVLKKLNSKYYVLKRCANKLNFDTKKLYVSSLVLTHFHYCPSILFLLTEGQLNEFQKVKSIHAPNSKREF